TRPARGRSRPRSRARPRRDWRTGGSTDRRTAGSVEPRRRCSRSPRRGSRPRARRLSLHESEDHDEVAPVHLQGIPPLGLLAEPHLRAQGAARRHREVLLPVDRIAHDAARLRGAEAEGPELLTILRVERDDLALGGPLEDQVAGGRQRVADERRPVRPLPDDLVLVHVEGPEDTRLNQNKVVWEWSNRTTLFWFTSKARRTPACSDLNQNKE